MQFTENWIRRWILARAHSIQMYWYLNLNRKNVKWSDGQSIVSQNRSHSTIGRRLATDDLRPFRNRFRISSRAEVAPEECWSACTNVVGADVDSFGPCKLDTGLVSVRPSTDPKESTSLGDSGTCPCMLLESDPTFLARRFQSFQGRGTFSVLELIEEGLCWFSTDGKESTDPDGDSGICACRLESELAFFARRFQGFREEWTSLALEAIESDGCCLPTDSTDSNDDFISPCGVRVESTFLARRFRAIQEGEALSALDAIQKVRCWLCIDGRESTEDDPTSPEGCIGTFWEGDSPTTEVGLCCSFGTGDAETRWARCWGTGGRHSNINMCGGYLPRDGLSAGFFLVQM